MNKVSHLLITGEILSKYSNVNKKQRLMILLGSILPDILVYTYLRGHTWEDRSSRVFEKIRKYEGRSRHEFFFFLQYGCILHYIEDFFTWTHNSAYEGTIREHVNYENRLYDYMVSRESLPEGDCNLQVHLQTAEQLISQLKTMHDTYMKTEPEMVTDQYYITKVAGIVAEYFLATAGEEQYEETGRENGSYPCGYLKKTSKL
ncbi:MAG: zinc dependent phospholipase C family protein [Eubacteriales bacterium]